MTQTTWFLLMVSVVVIAASVFAVLLYRNRGTEEERLARRKLAEARRTHKVAEKRYEVAVRDAERSLNAAEQSYKSTLGRAERHLAMVSDPRGALLASFRGITLWECYIQTPHGQGPVADAKASADTAGGLAMKSRATLTRMAAGGLLLGPLGAVLSLGFKKHKEIDKRELYLLVETPTFSSVIQCKADEGLKAREFAAKVNTAGLHAAQLEKQRPQMIASAQQELKSAETNTDGVQQAKANLDAVRKSTELLSTIENARRHLDALQGASEVK